MKKQINQVRDFHHAFKSTVLETPTIPDFSRVYLRQNLLVEEVNELGVASSKGDIVEVMDAIIDSMYVLIGTAHEFGLAHLLEDCFDEVHQSNMSKLDKNGNPVFREDGKILKGENYFRPDLKKIL